MYFFVNNFKKLYLFICPAVFRARVNIFIPLGEFCFVCHLVNLRLNKTRDFVCFVRQQYTGIKCLCSDVDTAGFQSWSAV